MEFGENIKDDMLSEDVVVITRVLSSSLMGLWPDADCAE
jgi:hypothetical protein